MVIARNPHPVCAVARAFAMLTVPALLAGASVAAAQEFPTRPVRIVVGFTAGTAVDVFGRIIGQKLTEMWGQQVIVENIVGASSIVAAQNVARSQPDGHSMLFTSTALVVSPSLFKKLPYDLDRDFAPVTLLAEMSNALLMHPALPVRDVKGLIALARSRPGQLHYASAGTGSAGHLGMELMKSMAKLEIVEVPYKSSAQALSDTMSGEIALFYPSLPTGMPHIRSGRLKALAVSGAKRSQVVPDIPSMAEFLPGYEASAWYGVLVPAATPPQVIAKINRDMLRALQITDTRQKMEAQGADIVGTSPEVFSKYMRDGREKWDKLIKQLGIPPQ